ncbi:Uncharacterised protein [Mycobacteroides abscessus subsp. abscessus]|nr:Uncharacterised protein [Mycobacteroides abscessus subsp. abscessus]
MPFGRWSLRKVAVASAEVQMDSSGMSRPVVRSRACRSRGVRMELLVSTRNGVSFARNSARNSSAPGTRWSSLTSTPSISVR